MPKDNYADIIESIRPKTVVHPMNKSKDDFSDITSMLGMESTPVTEPSLSPEIGRVLSSGFDTEFPIPDSGSGKWTNKISSRQKPINPNVASEGYIFSPQQEQDLAVELGKQGKGAKEIIEELNKRRAYTPIPGAAGQKKGYFGGVTQEKGVLPSLARVGAELPANVLGGILGKVPDVKDQSVLESIGKAFTGFAGFLVGPMGAAKKIIGNMWAVREGSIAANYARQLGRGGLELGTASALSRTIPATEKYGPSIKAAGDIGKAFGQGAVFSAIFNVSGVIPTKPLRIATGAALTDLLRGGGQFTIDDTIKGIQDGTIDKQELTDRVFGYTMDIFFLSTTPSIKQRIESLMPFKRVDKLAAMVASNKMKQGKYQEAVAIVKNRFEKIKNDPEIRDKMSELVGKELSEIQKETMKEQAKTPKGRQDIIDEFAPEELETTLKLNAQKRQAEIDQMMVEAEVPVEEAPKVAKAVKAPETAMQQIERLVGEIKAFGKEIGYKPPLERGKLQVPVGKKKPVDTKLIEQDKRVQGVLSEIEKLEGLRATAEKATGMDLKSFYDKAIDDAIAVLPPGEKIELQSAVSNFRKKVYVTGIEKYYADKKAEAEAVKVAEKKKETAPVMGKEKPLAKRTMEELVDAGDIPAPEYEGKERRGVSEARQTIIDGYIKKELGGKDLSGKKLAPLTRSEKEVLDLYEAKHPDYVGKVREAMKGREGEPEKKAPAKAKTPEEVAKDHGVEYDGIQKGVEGKNFYTFTDKETGSTFNVKDLSEVKKRLLEMRKKFREAELVKIKAPESATKQETLRAELSKLNTEELGERAKAAGLKQTIWIKAGGDREYVENHIIAKELKPSEAEVKPDIKVEPEVKAEVRSKLQDILAQDKLTQEDVKWLKENRDALDLSKEETQAIKMRIAGNLVKRIISEEKFQKNSESIKKYLRGLKVFTGVPEPKIIRALGENAIYHIERGVTDFYQWSKGVIKQFGEKIRPYLHNAWKNAQEGIKLGDPFYSQMSRTLDKKIQGKFASIDQVRGILKDVSAEEVRWSGIEEFLDNTSQSKWGTINASAAKISKQELMDFIAENSIKIEEVKRGKVGKTKHEEVLNLLPGYENYQEITYNLKDRRSFKEVERLIGTTRWKLNQLVAEEDTVPFKREFGRTSYEGEVFTTNLDRIIREGRIPIKMASHLQLLKELGFKVGKVYVPDPTKIRLGSTRTRMIVDLKFQDVKFTGQIYYEDRIPTLFIYDQFRRRISHFYRIREFLEKNAITKKDTEVAEYHVEKMHEAEREVRLLYNLKKLTKGPRIKLIKEFEKGFKSHAFPEEDTIGWSLLTDRTIEGKKYLHLEEQQSDYAKAIKRGKTEDAPLVRKHQEYALKRLMRMAVEEGYDGLSWSSGKIVKDRWKLSNYIDKLFVNVSEEGLYNLIGYKEGISAVNKSGITENELPDYIGKELSKRVSEGNREFTGIDLDMGGQWAEAFYDKIIPNFVDKYVKKWGAKVEDVKFKTNIDNYPEEVVPNIYKDGNRYRIKDWETGENLTEDIFNTKGDAQRWIDVHSMTPVKSVSFTPEMRFDITIKGQPLFGVPKGRQFFVGEADYFKSLNNIKKYFKGEKPYGEKLHAGIGLDPQLVTDVARVMRFHIEKGTKDFYRVSQELIKEFGEGIKPYLKTAWKDAQYITNYRGVRELKDNIWVSGIGSQTEGKGVYTALTKEQAANFGEKVIEVKYKKPKSERVLRVINEELPLLDQTEFSQTKPFEKDDTIWIRSNKEAYQKAIESSSKFVNELTKEERDIINRNVKYKKNPMYTEIMIDNFMENNLGNILKDKGYDVIEIRDRHGVKGYGWNVILNKDLIITSGSGYDKSLANIKAYFKGEKPYGEKLYSGLPLDPELVTDVARVIRFKMEAGAKDFYKTSQELIKEFGEKVRPYLKPAWDKAKGQIEVATMNKKDLKSANDALVKMGLKTLSEVEAENISPEIVNEPGLIKRFMSTLESTDQTLEAYKGGAQEHINAVPRIMVEETFIPKQIWLVDKFKQLNTVMKGVRRSIKAGELSRVGKEANKLGQEVSEVLELKDITEATGKYSPRSIEIAKDVRKILDEILVELQDANVLDKKGKLIKRLEGYFPHITKETNMTEELQQYLNDALEGRHDDIIGAASGGVGLYGTAKLVPKFGHAERRAAEDYGLKDIETNPLMVLRRYVLAASRILYDKPGIEKARAEIERIPAGSMKDLSVKYIQNYMRISDSISGTLRLFDAKLARMGARSVLAFSTGLQTLHLGRIATQVWPELGTRYSFAGLYELVANPSKAWAETRDAGLLPQSSIPSRFKFRGEVFDKLSGYGDFGNSIAKIIAYQGFLRKVFNQHPDWTFKQIQTEAVKQTIKAEGVINQATKSIALEKIPKFFLQFKYWFQKYGENTARAVASAAKDPNMENMTRVGRYLVAAAITEEISRQTGLKIFHITPYVVQLSATGAGYLKDIAWILANDKDSIETRLEKAFKRTMEYVTPGGVSIPRELNPKTGPTAIKKHK